MIILRHGFFLMAFLWRAILYFCITFSQNFRIFMTQYNNILYDNNMFKRLTFYIYFWTALLLCLTSFRNYCDFVQTITWISWQYPMSYFWWTTRRASYQDKWLAVTRDQIQASLELRTRWLFKYNVLLIKNFFLLCYDVLQCEFFSLLIFSYFKMLLSIYSTCYIIIF